MEIQEKDVGIQLMCSIEEVKEIYRALFQTLRSSQQELFDESGVLMELQHFLQSKAREAGVDATIHMDWERFLGYERPVPCEQRYADYANGANERVD